jgi:DNA phosphorothioation-associated putative methyltransferase
VAQAVELFIEKYGEVPLKEARKRRKEDLQIYLISGEFKRRRPPIGALSASLRHDVKTFFGSYAAACEQSRKLLFQAGDPNELEDAMEGLDFGWFDGAEGHFTIHRSLLDRLPPVMRAYVECGSQLYGNPREADLIKLHLRSRKLTLLNFDDFEFESVVWPRFRKVRFGLTVVLTDLGGRRHGRGLVAQVLDEELHRQSPTAGATV